ncbi:MAG: SpvB/TcaC N-terminal domain-containing protein, partial [Umezawaea sp.]
MPGAPTRRSTLSRRLSRRLILVLVPVLTAGVVTAGGSVAVAAPYQPGRAQQERPVSGVRVQPGVVDVPRTGAPLSDSAPVFPAATTADVEFAPAKSADLAPGSRPAAVRAAGTPVLVEPGIEGTPAVATAGVPSRVRVQTFDHETGRKAGVDGLLVRVSSLAAEGPARVSVDYSGFRWAYGADWAQRLRLTELPECALSTPGLPECQGRPVDSVNNASTRTVTATVGLKTTSREAGKTGGSGGTLLALAAGTSSGSGDYSATSLTSSGTWAAGSNAGAFTWDYPLRTPPSLGGPSPSLALSYSSAGVDGRVAASNNQPSWVGEGFDLDSGYIERKYRPCTEDMTGGNNSAKTGDQCWATDNATLAMSGHVGELVKDGADGSRWHLLAEDGTRIEHRTGAANGARDGEHWVVTTVDGVQYFFGNAAASALLVPVAGNHPNEPCHATAFADSFCTQGWRWYLDHVVDPHGNTMSYSYTKETNKYGKNGKDTDPVGYDRAAYLNRVDYGTRADRTENPPMQVVFDTADRCLADCGKHDAEHWADVPWDQSCDASPCKVHGPTFWSTKRLAKVTTKVGGNPVESWTLTHSFPNPGDGSRAGLWLDRISHSGLVGQTTPTPDLTFVGTQKNNRVDTASDQYAAMNWWRVKTINTESGGKVDVTYSEPDCVAGSRMPNPDALQDNHLLCYPVKWIPDGKTKPILDYFHKYVVRAVTETDMTGGASTRTVTRYDYQGDPAWHYTDDDGLIGADYKTWSVWRGYGAVRAVKGDPGEETLTEIRYFRGMHGDHLPSGTRNVVLPAVGGVPAVNDEDAFAGLQRESITYNGPGGAEVSAQVSQPWQSEPTATRTVAGSTVTARYAAVAGTRGRTTLDGNRGVRTTSSTTVFDGYGMPVRAEDRGDDAVPGDEKCTLTDYARNTSAWILAAVSRVRGFAVDCGKVDAGGLTDDDVVGDDRTYYDSAALGVGPTKGDATKTEGLKAYNGGNPAYLVNTSGTFDVYGRVTQLTDLKGSTTTAYTPALGGPVTQTETKNLLGWPTTTTVDPAWGLPRVVVDVNQRRSELDYDGLGRTTAVWLPGRDRALAASQTFTYLVRNNGPTAVTTRKLNASGGYAISYQLYDGLLRPRQTQKSDASGLSGNAVVTDAYYDSAGRSLKTNDPYLGTAPPGTDLFRPNTVIPSQVGTQYDGAGRTTATIYRSNAPVNSPGGTELWRTTTAYTGDRVDVTPPKGGVPTSTLVDAAGRTTQLRQYHAGVAAGSADPAGYDTTKYSYDRKDHLVGVTDPAGSQWTYAYDFMGRQSRSVDPDKGTLTSTYNDAGELLTTTDARGGVLATTYDQLSRKTSLRTGSATGPQIAEWVYDTLAKGQLT